jgi:hypothetical protein
MKIRLVSYFVLLSSFLLTAHDVDDQHVALLESIQEKAEGIVWHKSSLCPEDLQLLLNLTTVAYALLITELKLQEEGNFLVQAAWQARYNQDNFSEQLMIARSCERHLNYAKAKYVLNNAYAKLYEQINASPDTDVAIVTKSMMNHAIYLMKAFAKETYPSMQKISQDHAQELQDIANKIAVAYNTHTSLIAGDYPFQTEQDKEIDTIELHQQLADTVLAPITKQLLMQAQEATQISRHALEFSAMSFYVYYTVIQKGMKDRNVSNRYFTALFEDNCVVSADPITHEITQPIIDKNIPLFNH